MEKLENDNTIFRNKVEVLPEAQNAPQEPRSDKIPDTTSEYKEKPPSLRQKFKEPPLLIDLIEAKDIYDTFDVKEQSKEIDDFINSEIRRLNYKDDRKSYQKILDKYITKLDLRYTDVYAKIEKLASYLRIEQKLLQGLKEREELLNTDITKLSSDRIKKYMELKSAN